MVMEIKQILLSEQEICSIVGQLAQKIEQDYEKKDLVVVGVLKGAFIFMADLVRQIKIPLTCDFLRIQSYGPDGRPGYLRLEFDITQSIAGKNVLVLEDVVDTGRTLEFIAKHLETKGAKSVRFCTMIHKQTSHPCRVPLHYCGKILPDVYIVGYGMDLDGQHRNLPFIGAVELIKS